MGHIDEDMRRPNHIQYERLRKAFALMMSVALVLDMVRPYTLGFAHETATQKDAMAEIVEQAELEVNDASGQTTHEDADSGQQAVPEKSDDSASKHEPLTLKYEDKDEKLQAEVTLVADTLFDKEGNAIPASEVELAVTDGDTKAFEKLLKDSQPSDQRPDDDTVLQALTVELHQKNGEQLLQEDQKSDFAEVKIVAPLPKVGEKDTVAGVEVYRLVSNKNSDDDTVERVQDVDWTPGKSEVTISSHYVGAYALKFEVERPEDTTLASTEEEAKPQTEDTVASEQNEDNTTATDVAETDASNQYVYEGKTIQAEVAASKDSVFNADDTTLGTSDVHLVGKAGNTKLFSEIADGYDGELRTIDLAFCDKEGHEADQVAGSTNVTLTIPAEEENAGISDVEVFCYNEPQPEGKQGYVSRVSDATVDEQDGTISFTVDELGSYAVRYTVDYYYEGKEFHMPGGGTMLLSELFDQLDIKRSSAEVEDIDFTNPRVIRFTRHDDEQDWTIKSIWAFSTEETMTLTFADGYQMDIVVLDDQTYSTSENMNDFLTNWKIKLGDEVIYSDDDTDDGSVLVFKDGVKYTLELYLAESPELGFATPETNPPEMYYQLPDAFLASDNFQSTINVNLGRKGSLSNNLIYTVTNQIGADGKPHNFLKLRWNWEDEKAWGYFRDSAQAKLKISITGYFDPDNNNLLGINGKEMEIRREDLHNAYVSKEGQYNLFDSTIEYTVKVYSDGTTSDITLTDTMGSALTYKGDITYNGDDSINTAGTTPQITQKTGNTFNVVIPAMNNGDCLTFNYKAHVDPNRIAVSGHATPEESGNTAQIYGDSYEYDNTAVYYEENIQFSDIEKYCGSKRVETIDGDRCYVMLWQVQTNSNAQYPLAGTEITDTIGETVQDISRYYGDGLTIKCYTSSSDSDYVETRHVSWEELGVDLQNDTSFTYHIPDTDPQYRYVITYETYANMANEDSSRLAVNKVQGKGGIAEAQAMMTPVGTGIAVSKKATNVSSNHVTWEIHMSLSDNAYDKNSLELWEYNNMNSSKTSWNAIGLPYRWLNDENGVNTNYKEALERVEVIGLEGDETFTVRYNGNRNDTDIKNGAVTPYYPEQGSYVIDGGFAPQPQSWMQNTVAIAFYKDSARENGGLNRPTDGSDQREIIVKLTTSFPEEWARMAEYHTLLNAERDAWRFDHINWVSVRADDRSVGADTDKISPHPLHVYKNVLRNVDTTTASEEVKGYNLLNYPNVIIDSAKTGKDFPDATVFPVFNYQVIVSGIEYDEPLVIEDTFDTELFELLCYDTGLKNSRTMTQTTAKWGNSFYPHFFGTSYFGWISNSNAYYPIYYSTSLNDSAGTRAESNGCLVEKTDSGARFTITELWKDASGNLYPFYGVQYFLVPKNLEALKRIEEMAKDNALAAPGNEQKATFINTASARGTYASAKVKIGVTNDFVPIDKTSETYIDLLNAVGGQYRVKLEDVEDTNGRVTRPTPQGVSKDDIRQYVMKYRIVLNEGKEKLNDGNDITAEDEYSSNLSVVFPSITITTDPVGATVSYDYSGNVGYFTFPDETKVTIEYEAVILQESTGDAGVSNEVRMLRHEKTLENTVEYSGLGDSSAFNPAILVKKYGSGHMERGLDGAQFQLYEYKHETYTMGDSNTAADWEPVMLTKPNSHPAIFTTQDLTIGSTYYGHGYAEISLSKETDGVNLVQNKVYGLREITVPVGTSTNGDTIQYQNPHSESFFCYVFSICDSETTADYKNFVYLLDDTMTIRNTPQSIALHLKKELAGNCTLTDADKDQLTYQVFRKSQVAEGEDPKYMPIMTSATDPDTGLDIEVLDNRFVGITYNQLGNTGNGVEISGLTVESGASAGEYLLVEYGNDAIMNNHPDWDTWNGTYQWSDGSIGNFSNTTHMVYDTAGENPQQVYGVEFVVTSKDVTDGDDKTVTLTNSYSKENLTLTANKRWTDPSGAAIAWPTGKKVKFTLGTINNSGVFTALSGQGMVVELDNKKDDNGEDTAGSAVFSNLPKNEIVNGVVTAIRYAVRETSSVSGYDVVYPDSGLSYAAFGGGTTVTIKNQVVSTSISASKAWDRDSAPNGAKATFRLYSYTGSDASAATWVSNVNDIELDGTVNDSEGTFGEKTAWQADFTGLPLNDSNGNTLHYLVKEIACEPVGYEPIVDYATDGGSITNKPASTTFSVTKEWAGTVGNAWPSGETITLQLKRKTRQGAVDDGFHPSFIVASDGIRSQDSIANPYDEYVNSGTWSNGTLTVQGLPKYDSGGNEWLYYVAETAIVGSNGKSVASNYEMVYRDKNGYTQTSQYTYSGGSITNVRSTKDLTVSKTVSGNMGETTKAFQFTVELGSSEDAFSEEVAYSKTGQDGTTTTGAMTFDSGAVTVALKHGESITFSDLPGALSFAVTESDQDAAMYQTEYSINGSAAVSGRSAAGPLSNNPVVSFTNTREGSIPSGVSGSGTVFLVALPLLAIGIVLLMKRRLTKSVHMW